MVDSCSSSPTYLHKFAKQWFTFWFQYGSMLPIPAAPVDSIIDIPTGNYFLSYDKYSIPFFLRK